MIPKIIHSAWFGRGEKWPLYKHCMATWREKLPDWQFMEVNEDNLDLDCHYIRSVLRRGEFVKATEIARLVTVHRHGGIYLDCDMEVLRDMSPLLDGGTFFGREDVHYISGACFGAPAGSEVLELLIEAFPWNTDGLAPANHYGPLFLTGALRDFPGVVIHPTSTFYPRRKGDTTSPLDGAYTNHHWAGSWLPGATPK